MFKFNEKLYLLGGAKPQPVTVAGNKPLTANSKKAYVENNDGKKFWVSLENLIRPEEWLQIKAQQQPQLQAIDFANPAEFAEALKVLMQPEQIKELCDRLADFLFGDREYAANTCCAKLGKYSKLIKEFDGLIEGQNAFCQTKQDGSLWLRHLYFKYTGIADTDWTTINQKSAEKVARNLSNQIAGLDCDRYEQSVAKLLQSPSVWEVGAGLIAASGRRPIEIIEVGFFEIDGDELLFSGQAKKRGEQIEAYSIPLIGCTPELFVEKIGTFRSSYEVQRFREQFTINGEVDLKKLSDPITKQICRRGIVPALAWIPVAEEKVAPTASDLRAAWVTVAEQKFKPEGKYSLLFRAEVLGHKLDVGSMPTLNYSRYAQPLTEVAEPAIDEPIIKVVEDKPAYRFALGESVLAGDRIGTIVEIQDGRFLVRSENFEEWRGAGDLQPTEESAPIAKMRAISLHQPRASLVATGQKAWETRGWHTNYRGPIAVHAAKKIPSDLLGLTCTRESVPLGAFVAIADLTDCVEMDLEFIDAQSDLERSVGDWQPGRFAWKLENVRPILPIPAKGRQGFWNWEMPRFVEVISEGAVYPVLSSVVGQIEVVGDRKSNIDIEEQCSKHSNFSQELADSDLALSPLADLNLQQLAKSQSQPERSIPLTGQIHQLSQTSEILELSPDSSTALLGVVPAKTLADVETRKDLKAIDPPSGGKCSEPSTNVGPLLSGGRTLKERCLADVGKLLPASEWLAIKSKAQSCYRQRKSERRTSATGSSLLPTPTTYPSGSKPGISSAGRNALETRLRSLLPTPRANDGTQGYNSGKTGGVNLTGFLKRDRLLMPGEAANPQVWGWMMGFPRNWCEEILMPDGLKALADLDGGSKISHLSELASPAKILPAAESASVIMEPPLFQHRQFPLPSEFNILPIELPDSAIADPQEKCPNNFVDAPRPEKNIEPSLQKSGSPVNGRHELDFYETPCWMSLLILANVPLSGTIGEVCSGHGAIARILKMAGHQVWTNDVDPAKPADYHIDAASPLLWGSFPAADWIITNPPYGNLSAPIVQIAYAHAKRGIVMLLRQDWDEGCGDRIQFLKSHPPTTKIVVPRYCFRKGKNGNWATDDDPVCIYIWDKKVTNGLMRCIWLSAEEIPLFHRTPDTAPSLSEIEAEAAKYVRVDRDRTMPPEDKVAKLKKFLSINQNLPIADRWLISGPIVAIVCECSSLLGANWVKANRAKVDLLNIGLDYYHNRGRNFKGWLKENRSLLNG